MTAQPLISLSTLAPERPTIAIDGTPYELALPEDFGLKEQAQLRKLHRQIAPIQSKDDPTDDEIAIMAQALDRLVGLVLPGLPEAVRGKLRDAQKLAILQAFPLAAEIRVGEGLLPPKSTTATSSPGSSDSTGETLSVG